MFPALRSRIAASSTAWTSRVVSRAAYSTTVPRLSENLPQTSKPATSAATVESMKEWDVALKEDPNAAERVRTLQAPNRATTWAASQQPREVAMSGPRFEQTIIEAQPTPMAAIELIHKQPVRWTKKRTVSCDGGGGPLGHPKIFINTDKPEIATCGYCGVPYAHEQHRAYLESLPATSYPLKGDVAELNES